MFKDRMRILLLILPVLLVFPLACGDVDEQRAALEEDELDRELDLALRGDSALATFEDRGAEATPQPESEPEARRPEPRPEQPPRTTAPSRSRPEPPPPPREESRPEPEPEPRRVNLTVPTGTTFAIRLNETLSTETSLPGDPFTATLDDPIVSADGEVLIPAGSTVRGRVTAADQSDRVGETAVIKVAFESVSINGRSYPLSASVVEAHPERRSRASGKEQAAKIAAGAAAGAILGQVLGKDTESTLKGAAVGAAAGTAIAMGTADVDAVLPAGSQMVIRLDAPVEVPRTVS